MKRKKVNILKKNYYASFLIFFVICSILVAILSNYILQYFQLGQSFEVVNNYYTSNTELFYISTMIIFVLIVFLWSLIGEIWITYLLTIIIAFSFGIANMIKINLRFEPIYPEELKMAGNPGDLFSFFSLEQYNLSVGKIVILIILSITVVVALIFISHKLVKKIFKVSVKYLDRKILLIRGILLVISSFLLLTVYNFNQPGNEVKKIVDKYAIWSDNSQNSTYHENGFVIGFIYNFPVAVISKPSNYSEESIKKIMDKYMVRADAINSERKNDNMDDTNLIYVMSESFSDPEKLKGISLAEDPIPYTKSLLEKYSSGNSFATNFGGGTANIEFEALTSISLWALSPQVTTPYQMFSFYENFPNVASTVMKNHSTTAIHAYSSEMYKRKSVYEKMGFEDFYTIENSTHFFPLENSALASDASAFEETLFQMSQSQGNDFIHLVTMQNHGPFDSSIYENQFEVSGTPEVSENSAGTYVQGLRHSDDAMKGFITELDKLPEKTVMVFWGDHLPSIYSEEILEKNTQRSLRETPLFIYTNFETAKEDLGTISPIYFMNHVLKLTDTKVTPYYALMNDLEKSAKVLDRQTILDGDDKKIDLNDFSKEDLEVINDYKMIWYDMLEGNKYSESFFEK